MRIVYEDDSIIVIHKDAGEATQTKKASAEDVVSMLKKHICAETGIKKDPYVGVIHRLDQPVEGLLVFAKSKTAAAELSRQIQGDLINKIYTATVEGVLSEQSSEVLIDYIYKDTKENKAVIADSADIRAQSGKEIKRAELSYKVLKADDAENISVLKIHLKTGRFHQIRAQLSFMGHPITGDVKYGAKKSSLKGIGLIASELDFIHPKTKEKMHFEIT